MKVTVVLLVVAVAIGNAHGDATCGDDGKTAPKKTSNHPPKHYNIILVGATGNLASKYLWQSLFEIFQQRFRKNEVRFQIYGAARQEQDAGRKIMSDLFLNFMKCSNDECREKKKSFVEATQYLRLKTERDFQNLAAMLDENTQSIYGLTGSPVTYEEGRLVYLSIPPSSYAKTSKYVNQYLRPKVGRPWFRVVLEKPFGRDLESARKLAKELDGYYDENEIYRIDHYLGKAVVKQILPFRYTNKDTLEPLLNREHVERVDIVMKEKDDVVGRTLFYNEVGIIRDVMQNHLTEMMTLIAMDLPDNSGNISDILKSKVRVLRQVQPPNRHTTLTAQYSSYNMEWLKEQKLTNNITKTATFAASVVFVDNDRWSGVPFVLMSGKKLDEKSSYVRVLFKNTRFCMRATEKACNRQKQLVFLVGGTNLKLPTMIAMSSGLPAPAIKSGWSVQKAKTDVELFGQNLREMVQLVPDAESEPYVELISAAMDGARHLFVSTEMLLASWRVWTPILELAEGPSLPRQYMGRGKDAERLDFVVTSRGIYYQLNEHDVFTSETLVEPDHHSMYTETPSQFRNSTLVTGAEQSVVRALVQDIVLRSEAAVAKKGAFHLAVPGGSTPIPLFGLLSVAPLSWERIHIWLVDERCVPLSNDQSNFKLLERHLLSQVKIPYSNVHPVYVDAADELCSEGPVRSDDIYESLIRRNVAAESFDLVILGVGSDGHVASLFPGQTPAPDRLVTYAEAKGHPAKRVTLTYAAINRASHVSVLVLGSAKHELVTAIVESSDGSTYPIVGVKPTSGSLTWYIDHDALFGGASV